MEFNATFIVAFVSFILFTIIMNLILYKPLSTIVAQRQKFIDDNYAEAKEKQSKSESILKDKERKIEKTKAEAKKLIGQKTDEVKVQKSQLTQEAQQKAGSKIDSAKGTLLEEKNQVKDVLSNRVVDLAQSISAKVLGEDISIQNVDGEVINKIMQEG